MPQDSPDPVVTRVKVGGQALPDGVMMRTERAWAVARADGTVMTGTVRPAPFAKVPLLRVVTGLAQALRLGFGATAKGLRRRSPGWPLIRALLLTEASALAFTWLASVLRLPLGGRWTSGMATWIVAIAVFRATSPASQWRYHGAEHKAVTAYEHGVDLGDAAAVLSCSRVHPRCGTNLVLWLAALSPFLGRLPWPVQPFAFLAVVAIAAETLALAGKRPASAGARVFLVPGGWLQQVVTTREPSLEEQRIGCRALEACLELHHLVAGASTDQPDAASVDQTVVRPF